MRIYQPKNELGQNLLNEGQVITTAQTLTKEISNGAITLTATDIADIAKWDVTNVTVTIGQEKMSFMPGVVKTDDSITVKFTDEKANELGFTSAVISLQLVDSQGFANGGGNNSYSHS